eukprot:358521-Chlamydomonas_euryale.AAC.3
MVHINAQTTCPGMSHSPQRATAVSCGSCGLVHRQSPGHVYGAAIGFDHAMTVDASSSAPPGSACPPSLPSLPAGLHGMFMNVGGEVRVHSTWSVFEPDASTAITISVPHDTEVSDPLCEIHTVRGKCGVAGPATTPAAAAALNLRVQYVLYATCRVSVHTDLLQPAPSGPAATCPFRTCCNLPLQDLLQPAPSGLAATYPFRTCCNLPLQDLAEALRAVLEGVEGGKPLEAWQVKNLKKYWPTFRHNVTVGMAVRQLHGRLLGSCGAAVRKNAGTAVFRLQRSCERMSVCEGGRRQLGRSGMSGCGSGGRQLSLSCRSG